MSAQKDGGGRNSRVGAVLGVAARLLGFRDVMVDQVIEMIGVEGPPEQAVLVD